MALIGSILNIPEAIEVLGEESIWQYIPFCFIINKRDIAMTSTHCAEFVLTEVLNILIYLNYCETNILKIKLE